MFTRFRSLLLVIPSITIYIGFFLAAAITYVMPKQYESFATIEIAHFPPAPDIASERLRLTSPDILEKVSLELELSTRWGTDSETAVRLLQKTIRTDHIRGTDLLRIHTRHTNREDVMDIINALCSAYSEERRLKWESDKQRQIRELRDAVTKQEQVVDALRQQLQEQENKTSPNPTADQHQLEQRRLQELRLSLIGDTLGGPGWDGMYSSFGIIIHDDPVIAEDPISPNAYFNLTLGAISGLFLGIPLAFAIMALLHRFRPEPNKIL